jgi:hypothetical protein
MSQGYDKVYPFSVKVETDQLLLQEKRNRSNNITNWYKGEHHKAIKQILKIDEPVADAYALPLTLERTGTRENGWCDYLSIYLASILRAQIANANERLMRHEGKNGYEATVHSEVDCQLYGFLGADFHSSPSGAFTPGTEVGLNPFLSI